MATPLGDGGKPDKRYDAKYRCKWCKDTWKTKNTSHLRMFCRNHDCKKVIRAYKFEVIDKLVVYKCEFCGSVLKQLKCLSKVSEVPYCTICQKDMVISFFKELWKKRRMYGKFYCDECHHWWRSGYAWDGVGQECRHCDIMVLHNSLKPIEFSPHPHGGESQPHRQDLCEMCKQLGRLCKSYVPTDDDIATIDEIPLVEDEQSVITTNSSIFGEDDSDSSSEGSRTPINSDDYLEGFDEDSSKLEEMMSVIRIGKNDD